MNKRNKIFTGITIIFVLLSLLFHRQIQKEFHNVMVRAGLREETIAYSRYAGVSAKQFAYDQMIASGEILAYAPELTEADIYSFLQGARSWGKGISWSGEWCQEYAKGQYFSGFGCGFCCMANLYCTFSEYTCSPLDVYEYALEATGYAPTRRSAAIDWGNMKVLLQRMGFSCDVYYKPATYEEFRNNIKNCKSAIVLVWSGDDDSFWQKIPGHYVTISLYEEATDDVFLAEPGSPTKNRTRVPLKTIYNSLKSTSKFQYLMIDGYTKSQNQWQHDGIDEQWIRP